MKTDKSGQSNKTFESNVLPNVPKKTGGEVSKANDPRSRGKAPGSVRV